MQGGEDNDTMLTNSGALPASSGPRGVGRPSTVAAIAPLVEQWLRTEPTLSGADILRRAQRVGYNGGKSALYELVRRLRFARQSNPGEPSIDLR